MKPFFLILVALFSVERSADAYVLPLAPSVAEEALSESVPTAFALNDWSVDDFALEWAAQADGLSGPLTGVKAELEPRSLEWVRVSEVLVVPRARLILAAQGIEAGRASNAGFSQAFTRNSETGVSEVKLPVALISGEGNGILVTVKRAGKEESGRVFLKFKPRNPGQRFYIDPSCSRFGVAVQDQEERSEAQSWAYAGCRLVQTEALGHRTSSLEVFLFWDNVGRQIEIGGIRTPFSSYALWALRLQAEPDRVELKGGGQDYLLRYWVPREYHRGLISVGLGPYSWLYRNNFHEKTDWIVMPTFYASYAVTETMRVVAFDATTLNYQFITDFGLYVNSEYIRTLDRRFALNLMLGVHFLGFRDQQYYFKVGLPQGVEMVYTDFLMRGRNLSLGGFIYPAIQGKSYYNTWLRWGSGQLFGEVNYISWEERIDEKEFAARSLGVTLGFPIPFLRFL